MNILKSFGLLVLGVIIGMICQCNKYKQILAKNQNNMVHDTLVIHKNTTELVQREPIIIDNSRTVVKYKSIFKHDTTTVDVIKKEIVYRDRWNSDLLLDTACRDSLKTTMVLVDTLLSQVAELSKLKIYKDTLTKKEYSIKLSVLGQNVKQTSMEIIINPINKSNFSINPKTGLNFNNGKVINASVGLGIGYKKFTLDGLYTPQTKQYGVLLGYNKQF
jgi:hypothetical protein